MQSREMGSALSPEISQNKPQQLPLETNPKAIQCNTVDLEKVLYYRNVEQTNLLMQLLSAQPQHVHFASNYPIYVVGPGALTEINFETYLNLNSETYLNSFVFVYTPPEINLYFIKNNKLGANLMPYIQILKIDEGNKKSLKIIMNDICNGQSKINPSISIDKQNNQLTWRNKEKLYGKIAHVFGHKYIINNLSYCIADRNINFVGGNILKLPNSDGHTSEYLVYKSTSTISGRTEIHEVIGEFEIKDNKINTYTHLETKLLVKTEHISKDQYEEDHLEEKIEGLNNDLFSIFPELGCKIIVDDVTDKHENVIYTVMNKLSEPDLSTLLEPKYKESLTDELSIAIASAVVEKLEMIHRQGVLHLDIKPANIKIKGLSIENGVIRKTGKIEAIVIDLDDLIRFCNKKGRLIDLSQDTRPFGSKDYVAPELRKSPKADVYSMGITLLRLKAKEDVNQQNINYLLATIEKDPLHELIANMINNDVEKRWDIKKASELMKQIAPKQEQETKLANKDNKKTSLSRLLLLSRSNKYNRSETSFFGSPPMSRKPPASMSMDSSSSTNLPIPAQSTNRMGSANLSVTQSDEIGPTALTLLGGSRSFDKSRVEENKINKSEVRAASERSHRKSLK